MIDGSKIASVERRSKQGKIKTYLQCFPVALSFHRSKLAYRLYRRINSEKMLPASVNRFEDVARFLFRGLIRF